MVKWSCYILMELVWILIYIKMYISISDQSLRKQVEIYNKIKNKNWEKKLKSTLKYAFHIKQNN